MKQLILASALFVALSAPTLALAQCHNCPAAERERADQLNALESDYQAKEKAFRQAHSAYFSFQLEARETFHALMTEIQKNKVRALGSPAVRVNGSERALDQIALATRDGNSVKIMLTPEGRAIAGINSAEQEERALEEIAVSLRVAFPNHALQTRLFGGGDHSAWRQTQSGGAILGASFERFPLDKKPLAAAARLSERLGAQGRELWARLEAADARLQASDAALRSATGSFVTPLNFLSVPAVVPPRLLLAGFLKIEARELGDALTDF